MTKQDQSSQSFGLPVGSDAEMPVGHPVLELGREVSIGVAAHGNPATTRQCLRAILASLRGDFELILVDDGSDDDNVTLAAFAEAESRHENTIVYQNNGPHLEYSGSVNLILSHARGEYVFFVSNDIFVSPYYFSAMLEAMAADTSIGTARGSSNFVDNQLPSHNLPPARPVDGLADVFRESRDLHSMYAALSMPELYLTGDAFAVRRELIDKIGTFDPLFYGYFADHDYGLRAQISGFATVLVPGAYAYHQQGGNLGHLADEERQLKLQRRWMRVFENWARFKIKYQLPVNLDYPGVNAIAWSELARQPFTAEQHYSRPLDYTAYKLAAPR